jgi:ribosomal protein S18 acetylase RimI-like enzyme
MAVELVKATIKDAEQISELAGIIWHQHYSSIISIKQITYMLDLMYSNDALQKQMNDKQHTFYLIKSDSKIIGFISTSAVENVKGSYFIHKFYILQDIASKGIGTKAFLELVKILKPEELRLTVNRQNFKSINFYFKNNFKIESIADFDIGNGYMMNDFVMIWKANHLGH